MTDAAREAMPDGLEVATSSAEIREAWRGDGYPDLRAIPKAPTNLPDARAWAQFQTGLEAAGTRLAADPRATLASEIPPAETWAEPLRADMAADPGLAPPPEWMRDTRWYRQLLEDMNRQARRAP